MDMLIVLDTNVLYQALRSNKGASHYILELIRNRKLHLAISIPVFSEYEEVLKRKTSLEDLNLTFNDIHKVIRYVAYIGKPYNTYYRFRPNLKDEDDNIFVELAITCNAQFLITSNIKDYKNSELKFNDLNIITPSNFITLWRNANED